MASDPIPTFRLDGKVAIVTGASSGIGRRMAIVLAGAGATVLAAARRKDRLDALAEEHPGIVGSPCDVSVDADLHRLVAEAADLDGDLAVVVNNAGTTDAVTPALHQDPDQFRSVVDVNLNACFVLAAAAARHMVERDTAGSIINIASIHGLVAAAPNSQAGYAASKGGLVMLTRELAGQWARAGIRVNAIAPGYFETELTEAMFEGEDTGLRYIRRGTMLGRAGELPELDGPLLLLASDAGSYITGQTIAVDGGWTAR